MKATSSIIASGLCLLAALSTIAAAANDFITNNNSNNNATPLPLELLKLHRRGNMIPMDQFLLGHQEFERRQLQADPTPRYMFCDDLGPLERYLERNFLQTYSDLNVTLSLKYECECSTIGINWKLQCSADYYGNRAYYLGTNVETAIFSLTKNNVYRMVEAWWGDSEYGDEETPQETYYLNDYGKGTLFDCTGGNGCGNCTVCDDRSSIQLECLDTEEESLRYVVNCEDGYMGSYLPNYNFGLISEDFDPSTHTGTVSSMFVGNSLVSHVEFCSNLTELEQFMDSYFLEVFKAADKSNNGTKDSGVWVDFNCQCSEETINLYLKCVAPYTYRGLNYTSRDSAQFEAQNGVFELVKTSWGDSMFNGDYDVDQEEFFYQNGRLIGCRYEDCDSCRICADGINARCEDVAMNDTECYQPASFSSVYDYGTIVVGVMDSNRDFSSRPRAVSGGTASYSRLLPMVMALGSFALGLLWM